jgi:hypothetical protein
MEAARTSETSVHHHMMLKAVRTYETCLLQQTTCHYISEGFHLHQGDDANSVHLRNAGLLQQECMMLHPTRL